MKRSQRRLMWLLTGAAILVAVAAWQWHSERGEKTLLALDPVGITRIDITWLGQPTRHFSKRDGHWYRAGRRVDDAHLARMAELAATPVLEWRATADMHTSKIGLQMPSVVVTLDGHTLAFGSLAAFGPERFVRVGDRIAVIPASYSPRAPARPGSSAAAASSSQKS